MSVAKLNVAVNNMACVMNLTVLLPYLFRIVLGPLPIEVIIIILNITIKLSLNHIHADHHYPANQNCTILMD